MRSRVSERRTIFTAICVSRIYVGTLGCLLGCFCVATASAVQAGGGAPVATLDAASGEAASGVVEPAGSVQAGSVQAGSVQAGSVQAGSVQAGSVQTGSVQAGSVHPGAPDTGSDDSALAGDYGAGDSWVDDAGAFDSGAGDFGGGDSGRAISVGAVSDGDSGGDGSGERSAGQIETPRRETLGLSFDDLKEVAASFGLPLKKQALVQSETGEREIWQGEGGDPGHKLPGHKLVVSLENGRPVGVVFSFALDADPNHHNGVEEFPSGERFAAALLSRVFPEWSPFDMSEWLGPATWNGHDPLLKDGLYVQSTFDQGGDREGDHVGDHTGDRVGAVRLAIWAGTLGEDAP